MVIWSFLQPWSSFEPKVITWSSGQLRSWDPQPDIFPSSGDSYLKCSSSIMCIRFKIKVTSLACIFLILVYKVYKCCLLLSLSVAGFANNFEAIQTSRLYLGRSWQKSYSGVTSTFIMTVFSCVVTDAFGLRDIYIYHWKYLSLYSLAVSVNCSNCLNVE